MSALSKFVFLIGIAVLLGACQSGSGTRGTAQPDALSVGPTPGLEARERFSLALRLLEKGDTRQARAELVAYKAAIPDSEPVNLLLDQIDSPVGDYFPTDYFVVDLGTGETLSTLAKAYLGNALKFYGLARYNGISNPSHVTVGQAIRIPRTSGAIAAKGLLKQKPSTASAAGQDPAAITSNESAVKTGAAGTETRWDEIRDDVAKGKHKRAIEKIEEIGLENDISTAQLELAASTYAARAGALRSGNSGSASEFFIKSSEIYLRLEKPEEALRAAESAVQASPGHKGARKAAVTAKQSVAEKYYRMGSAAFQKQELDAAVAHWSRVLEIDPGHSNAKLRRAQALELKEKLSKLSKGS